MYSKLAKVLTEKGRKQIKEKNFALSGERYPIHDEVHARNALARIAQHGTPAEQAIVRAKVHKKFPGIEQESAKGKETSPMQKRAAFILAKLAAEPQYQLAPVAGGMQGERWVPKDKYEGRISMPSPEFIRQAYYGPLEDQGPLSGLKVTDYFGKLPGSQGELEAMRQRMIRDNQALLLAKQDPNAPMASTSLGPAAEMQARPAVIEMDETVIKAAPGAAGKAGKLKAPAGPTQAPVAPPAAAPAPAVVPAPRPAPQRPMTVPVPVPLPGDVNPTVKSASIDVRRDAILAKMFGMLR